jgi:hypothetical protein
VGVLIERFRGRFVREESWECHEVSQFSKFESLSKLLVE